MGDKGTI